MPLVLETQAMRTLDSFGLSADYLDDPEPDEERTAGFVNVTCLESQSLLRAVNVQEDEVSC
jgi:hypothetical protein